MSAQEFIQRFFGSTTLDYPEIKTLLSDPADTSRPLSTVTSTGRVMLKLRDPSGASVDFGTRLSRSIPHSNGWYTEREENLHITIGVYHGADPAGFQNMLDADLRDSNLAALVPVITSRVVELSEEFPSQLRRTINLRPS